MNSVFVFRRDLRLIDNTGLISSLEESGKVLCAFILDPRQLKGPYFSDNAFEFMLESLEDLKRELKKAGGRLHLFTGPPHEVIASLLEEGFEAVYVNRDYTPFSRERDEAIKEVCEKHGAVFASHGDSLLNDPESVLKKDGKPYTVYTPYLRKAQTFKVRKPLENKHRNYHTRDIPGSLPEIPWNLLEEKNKDLKAHGGRENALSILSRIKDFAGYGKERDFPALDATSHLSAHNKFGTCSIREVYHAISEALGSEHPLVRQLYWRDFYTQIAFHHPRVFGSEFREKYSDVEWSYDKKRFNAWREGKTGYPLVDAGMRELDRTGYMHNRVRMIAASFLTKDLHIDWRWGERYFATKLLDYDPCVNNGNWQWAASTGCDPQPYFRIFNPGRQQERFDPECEYVKTWIPELREYSPKEILKGKNLEGYPEKIIDHGKESLEAKAAFASVR